jgi:hypothetical protein
VDRIFKGAKPGELPIEQSTKYAPVLIAPLSIPNSSRRRPEKIVGAPTCGTNLSSRKPQGYAYDEIGCDSGSGDRVGCFQSRVFGVGPQVGFIIPVSTTTQGYLNIKGYKEFENQNRPDDGTCGSHSCSRRRNKWRATHRDE